MSTQPLSQENNDVNVSNVILQTKQELTAKHKTLTEQLLQIRGAMEAVRAMEARLVTSTAASD